MTKSTSLSAVFAKVKVGIDCILQSGKNLLTIADTSIFDQYIDQINTVTSLDSIGNDIGK
jgi:hypothetical protein